ncbi:MAG: CDP-diacylglycerol--glycerol-3-phosphate 3-phosphatidyltransferase [Planctomycetaceae bacterium]|nr:CDP-diacylglycerol--glycerol-3-phosphate 3-phosphatidyltransferase [Planctomycetaceae bacterium]
MSSGESNQVISSSNWNVPNGLTIARIVLAFVLFGVLECQYYIAGLVLFLIAAVTDWIDGWWARKYNQCTVLGRIMDPFADKLIVCGTLIYLATIPAVTDVKFGLAIWMVVVIIAREMLITTIRSFLEQQGRDFSAKMAGKLKMWLQCVAIPACLLWVIFSQCNEPCKPAWLYYVMVVSVWGTLLVTLYSGLLYIVAAMKLR